MTRSSIWPIPSTTRVVVSPIVDQRRVINSKRRDGPATAFITTENAIAFLAKDPTFLGRVNGVDLYEHPSLGDESPLMAITPEGKVLVPPNEITLVRDVTHDDSKVLAKDIEENLLWRDMHTDLVGQIMRRLSVVKPLDPNREDAD